MKADYMLFGDEYLAIVRRSFENEINYLQSRLDIQVWQNAQSNIASIREDLEKHLNSAREQYKKLSQAERMKQNPSLSFLAERSLQSAQNQFRSTTEAYRSIAEQAIRAQFRP